METRQKDFNREATWKKTHLGFQGCPPHPPILGFIFFARVNDYCLSIKGRCSSLEVLREFIFREKRLKSE